MNVCPYSCVTRHADGIVCPPYCIVTCGLSVSTFFSTLGLSHKRRDFRNKYRVSREECKKIREGVPYVKIYRYNPKHLYPKLNRYGDNGQRKVWSSLGLHTLYLPAEVLSASSPSVRFHIPSSQLTQAVNCICTSFRVTSALAFLCHV
jgi:hypothetical protein